MIGFSLALHVYPGLIRPNREGLMTKANDPYWRRTGPKVEQTVSVWI